MGAAGHTIVLRYHEIALKGRNRPFFVRRLLENVERATAGLPVGRVRRASARLLLPLADAGAWPAARERLARIFGVVNFALAHELPLATRAGDAAAEVTRLGASGRVLALLSGGIDSPVAAWRMMRRGCRVDLVHFHSVPFLDRTSQEKARELARLLVAWELRADLYLVPFGEVQRQIVAAVGRPLRVVLYRRMMLRIAETLARRAGAEALVTGDSLGQVASQTLANLAVVGEAAALPVLRPLVGMDKSEIAAQAERIGTFETSIIPDQDCCTLFTPRHPATRAERSGVAALEARLDVTGLVAQAVAATE